MSVRSGPVPPIRWTPEQLDRDRLEAIELFRRERMEEPLEDYLQAFDDSQGVVEELLEESVDLSQLDERAGDFLTDPAKRKVFRYLAGPPISEDDLKTVADVPSLSPKALRENPDAVRRVVYTVKMGLDRRRFSWVSENREPTESERQSAIQASAALIAQERAATKRRSLGKTQQEYAVQEALEHSGFKLLKRKRSIDTIREAPGPGEFCLETKLGTRKADLIVGLWDTRILPIECKVSNSAVNSIKRLNNDAAVKAQVWHKDFGTLSVVPTAVLAGVFELDKLVEAQQRGLTLIWAHRLSDLIDWIERTRS